MGANIAKGIEKVCEFAPPPFNTALKPLGEAMRLVFDQVCQVTKNKEAAQGLAKRVAEGAQTINELILHIDQKKDPTPSKACESIKKALMS